MIRSLSDDVYELHRNYYWLHSFKFPIILFNYPDKQFLQLPIIRLVITLHNSFVFVQNTKKKKILGCSGHISPQNQKKGQIIFIMR